MSWPLTPRIHQRGLIVMLDRVDDCGADASHSPCGPNALAVNFVVCRVTVAVPFSGTSHFLIQEW
jgi:hypothetical protein